MVVVITAIITVALFAAACTGTGLRSGDRQRSSQLIVGFTQEPADWNFLRNPTTAIRSLLFYNVVETLITQDADGRLRPLLAKDFRVTADGKRYVFELRNATFHNGERLSGEDVVYSAKLARASPLSEISAPFRDVRRIAKIDDRTVEFTLATPSRAFALAMATKVPIIPSGSEPELASHPVGTGPFSFAEWRNGVRVVLEADRDYWGRPPAFARVEWRFIADLNAALNALLAGDIDVLPAVIEKNEVRKVDNSEGFTSVPVASQEILYVTLNARSPKFRDPLVRQAIAHAIDRDTLAEGMELVAKPTCVLINPPTELLHSDHCPYRYDPALARRSLAEAGVEGLRVRFPYFTDQFSIVTEILAQQLGHAGVELEPENMDLATYADRVVGNNDFEATVVSGPQQIESWRCPGWYTGDCLPALDRLLAEADAAATEAEWARSRRAAAELQAERAFVIPLGTVVQNALHRDDLTGFATSSAASEFDLRGIHWVNERH
ncbi:hypothetical protein BAY61_14815 [Prauserella marina]|uniref:Peptide/nickel transport system substrate-binding protein n=1 Tax=Prauserella marina TaxID=530584 RepID=A0A222VQQ1_9PSEU|nr:ABC transporter substrate-binding protein [Prauserella marina]ASR36063.1 hypothetical protein BAY61_14815 [Prauserella marina]PWV76790.1 peptide/nickel transport system substrate-binding protein [Prauserella marina]SDC97683.1 peptide/nickel transport system substrate-binding protein [Prauserella marina]